MEFVVEFERRADLPLYRSLSDAIKLAISDGRLQPGQKVPSVRVLSELMEISRNTAHQCYQTLESEGFILAVQGKGIFVSHPMGDVAKSKAPRRDKDKAIDCTPPPTELTGTLLSLEDGISAHQRTATALKHQMPSLDDLPLQQIKKVFTKHSRLLEHDLLAYTGDPFGHPVLREAIANYLLRARAIKCSPEQIVVASRPSQELLDLVCRLFLPAGSYVAVEHPGYSQPRLIFQLHNAHILPIPVDDNGIVVNTLARETHPVKMAYVSPSHQDPTGVILSQDRRKQLIEWAKRADAIIWEDDVDNEYRYGSEPIPALFAMDNDNRVVYQSTFWRTLCPIIRLGFVVLPANKTKEIVHLAKYMLSRDLPIIEQLVLADLINEGHFERHVRLMRKKFTSRRQTAVHQLTLQVGSLMNISKTTSGLHLRALFDSSLPKEFILACAEEAGLPIASSAAYYPSDAPENEFLIKFAHTSEVQLTEQINAFATKLKSKGR